MTFPLTQSDNLVKSGEISTESPIFISLQFIYVRKDKEKPKHISTISPLFLLFSTSHIRFGHFFRLNEI